MLISVLTCVGQTAESQGLALSADASKIAETVHFGDRTVMVFRGPGAVASPETSSVDKRIETVSFANPKQDPVTVIRGSTAEADPGLGLFGTADRGELSRIAFAVEGAESDHGRDRRMWRPDADEPQGPMQVSAAAARDVGGGDRFDTLTNRMLGLTYLARLYQRYGNWSDALAAYNWGLGHLDAWIAAGRPEEKLPLETERYVKRVLHDAMISCFVRSANCIARDSPPGTN